MIPALLFFLALIQPPDMTRARITLVHVDGIEPLLMMLDEDPTTLRSISARETIDVAIGYTMVRVMHPEYADMVFGIEAQQGDTAEVRYPVIRLFEPFDPQKSGWFGIRNQANLYVETEDDTRIFLNGAELIRGPSWYDLPLDKGPYRLEMRHPMGGERTWILNYDTYRNFRVVRYFRPDRTISLLWSPLPGISQLYEQERVKGTALIGLNIGLLLWWNHTRIAHNRADASYQEAVRDYNLAVEVVVDDFAILMEQAHANLVTAYDRRRSATYALGAAYALHLIDAWWPSRKGYRKVRLLPDPYAPGPMVRIGM